MARLTTIGLHYEVGRLAAMLDMSVRYLKDQIKAGEIEAYRLGNKIVVPDKSLREFLRNHSIGKPPDPPDEAEAAA